MTFKYGSQRKCKTARFAAPDPANVKSDAAHRLLGLELRPLARGRLPEGTPAVALARALRDALRHGRGEQHLLPPPNREDRPGLGRSEPARVPLCGQGEPLSDTPEAADRHGRAGAAVLRA